ncbi:hypothetical protein OKW40_000159 [Paraburkholderia sp. RAU6.4a]
MAGHAPAVRSPYQPVARWTALIFAQNDDSSHKKRARSLRRQTPGRHLEMRQQNVAKRCDAPDSLVKPICYAALIGFNLLT